MPSGHTDRATINARKPLTDNMRAVLAEVHCKKGAKRAARDTGWKSAARALSTPRAIPRANDNFPTDLSTGPVDNSLINVR